VEMSGEVPGKGSGSGGAPDLRKGLRRAGRARRAQAGPGAGSGGGPSGRPRYSVGADGTQDAGPGAFVGT
jgi:hypothetical protein